MGFRALVKETPVSSLAPSSMGGHSGKTVTYKPRNSSSPDTKSSRALTWDFPGLVFKHPVSGTPYKQLEKTKAMLCHLFLKTTLHYKDYMAQGKAKAWES